MDGAGDRAGGWLLRLRLLLLLLLLRLLRLRLLLLRLLAAVPAVLPTVLHSAHGQLHSPALAWR